MHCPKNTRRSRNGLNSPRMSILTFQCMAASGYPTTPQNGNHQVFCPRYLVNPCYRVSWKVPLSIFTFHDCMAGAWYTEIFNRHTVYLKKPGVYYHLKNSFHTVHKGLTSLPCYLYLDVWSVYCSTKNWSKVHTCSRPWRSFTKKWL